MRNDTKDQLYDVEGMQVMDAIRKGWKIEM